MTGLFSFVRQNAAFLAAGFLLTFASSFGQTFFISVFAGEIRAEYGLSHGGWGQLYMVATMASALVMVWLGAATDHIRVRALGVMILFGLAASTWIMAAAGSLASLVLAVFLLRLLGQGMMSHVAMVAMGRWFVAARGRAVSVAALGFSIGEALLPLLFVALMGVFDWRWLWIGGGLFLVCLMPVLARLLSLERTPKSFAEEGSGVGLDGRMWTRAELLRHPLFWVMVPMIVGPSAWGTAFFFHQVHLAEAKGWSHASLVALFPFYSATAVASLILTGWLIDRFGSGRLIGFYLLPYSLGFCLMAATSSLAAGAVAIAIMGLSQGANSAITGTFWAEHFGTAHLGAIRATTTALMVLGSAIGPWISGSLIDQGLSFDQQGWAIAGYFVIAAVFAGIVALRANRQLRPA